MFAAEKDFSVYYHNLSYYKLPEFNPGFDLIIFHTSLLAERWDDINFQDLKIRIMNCKWLYSTYSVALPQDEFYKGSELDKLFVSLNIDLILGLIPSHEFRKIYPFSGRKSSYMQVLPFYLQKKKIPTFLRSFRKRKIDLSYRAWAAEPWLGQVARDKLNILRLGDFLKDTEISTDLSCDRDEQLENAAWLRLLKNSRWTLVTPGGASINDSHGLLRDMYLKSGFPNRNVLDFDSSYENLNFAQYDFSLDLSVITPRILEAASCGTALIGFPSAYNDKLLPGVHYFPIERDFSNLDNLIGVLNDERIYNFYKTNLQKLIFNDDYFNLDSFLSKFKDRIGYFPKRSLTISVYFFFRLLRFRFFNFYSQILVLLRFSFIAKVFEKIKIELFS